MASKAHTKSNFSRTPAMFKEPLKLNSLWKVSASQKKKRELDNRHLMYVITLLNNINIFRLTNACQLWSNPVSLLFSSTLSWATTDKCSISKGKIGETYRIGSALRQGEVKTLQHSDYTMWWFCGSLHIRWRHAPSRSLFHLRFVRRFIFLVVSARLSSRHARP